MTVKPPAAGQDILSYCGKCKMTLTHTIHAMKTKRTPARVECKTCNAVHAYRKEPGTRKASTRTRKPAVPKLTKAEKEAIAIRENYEKMLSKIDASNPTPYSIDKFYEQGEVIDHSKFGIGIITTTLTKKVKVMFGDGEKTMMQGDT